MDLGHGRRAREAAMFFKNGKDIGGAEGARAAFPIDVVDGCSDRAGAGKVSRYFFFMALHESPKFCQRELPKLLVA
jgi:hypothetical protein